ncbi:cell division site-positioning protein MapZ family protein [Enterococcus massiliensis]|uniref:cell division site-positioning protein MapZ family protein n=1 Tax=Enterococcus massiliensis TaxID=1640685 RepID=UPI00065DC58B|nr:cell division site-positioning protein MapZ family protein [Enterococcus massiliensis]
MINKCPQCGFEPVAGKMICPNCGFEIKENIAQKIEDQNEQKDTHKNDNIAWSDFKNVSIGSVMETFNEQHGIDEDTETTKSIEAKDEPIENPILSAYIRQHKGEEGETVEELVAKEQAEAQSTIAESTELIEEPVEEVDGAEENVISLSETKEITSAETAEATAVPEEIDEGLKNSEQASQPTEVLLEAESDSEHLEEVDDEEAATEEPIRNKPHKSRGSYLIAAAAVAVVGIGGWLFYDHQEKVAAEKAQEQKVTSALEDIQQQLDQFYLDSDQQFIKENKSLAELETVKTTLDKYENEEKYAAINASYGKLKEKFTTINQVNQLFDQPILVGDHLAEPAVYDSLADVTLEKPTGTSAFDQLVTQAIEKAEKQAAALQKATDAVALVYQKDQVKSDASRKNYQTANNLVKKLPDSTSKTAMLEALSAVDGALSKKETAAKEAAAKKAAEKEAAAKEAAANQAAKEQAAQQAALPAEASPNMQPNTNNQPILGTVASDVADANNPAWQWAAGVKEKVLATCIARGYIVEGGYTLEKVRIENGEGYYNLFATNTRSSLMKGVSDSALPFYLVTINCKTGYFRGNGSDNTIK